MPHPTTGADHGLLIPAALLALWGVANAVAGYRFHQGRAEYLRRRDYPGSSWSAFRRNFPYGLYPLAAMMLLTAAGMTAQALGVMTAPIFFVLYLTLMLSLGITMVILMATRRAWLASPHPPVTPPTPPKITEWPDNGSLQTLPRPFDEMTPEEIRAYAREDPARAKRLSKWIKREYGRRPPAIASAFSAAFLLGSLAAFIYFTVQGQPFFKHFTLRQSLIYAAFILIPWLLFWIIIVARRRRSG
jgi:hypothetical protein